MDSFDHQLTQGITLPTHSEKTSPHNSTTAQSMYANTLAVLIVDCRGPGTYNTQRNPQASMAFPLWPWHRSSQPPARLCNSARYSTAMYKRRVVATSAENCLLYFNISSRAQSETVFLSNSKNSKNSRLLQLNSNRLFRAEVLALLLHRELSKAGHL